MIFLILEGAAFAGAQVMAHLPHPTNPNLGLTTPVVEVRGNTPYVEIDHQLRAVKSASLEIFAGGAPSDPIPPPRWLNASNIQVKVNEIGFTATSDRSFNKELSFSLDLESPVTIDNVWIVLGVRTEKAGAGIIVQEIGTLSAYLPRNIVIHRKLTGDLGDTKYFWHVFVRDRELLNSQMNAEHVEEDMNYQISIARGKTQNVEAEPYLVFPPQKIAGSPDHVTLKVNIMETGEVRKVSILGDVDSKFKTRLSKAIEHWWFLPRVREGIKVPAKLTLDMDLSDMEHWSDERVRILRDSR